jgi:hypothetical protein
MHRSSLDDGQTGSNCCNQAISLIDPDVDCQKRLNECNGDFSPTIAFERLLTRGAFQLTVSVSVVERDRVPEVPLIVSV